MAQRVAGDLKDGLLAQLFEIERQVRQSSGYPFNPEGLRRHLQDGVEGRFNNKVQMYPEIGEVFELTRDGNDPNSDPIVMVRRDGYDQPERWKFKGEYLIGAQTLQFKLVSIGYQPNFDAVLLALAGHGCIPGGQWREVFKVRFTKPDGKGPIGIADASWVFPNDDSGFPCVHTGGGSGFHGTGPGFSDSWRWLVEVSN